MRIQIDAAFGILLCSLALGQPSPAFEIADARPSPQTISTVRRGPTFREGRFEILRANMTFLIATAYGVNADRIVGPNWVDVDRFDVIAKAPPETAQPALALMLQRLLAERFELSVHQENRPQPQYALVVGAGKVQMKQSDGAGGRGCRSTLQAGGIDQEVSCRNVPMTAIASALNALRGGYLDAPLVDATGLTGTWDADFRVTPSSARAASGDGTSLAAAAERLGLKLERRDIQVAMTMIDHVNRQPAANAPGVAEALPAPFTAKFEVVSIRPAAPGPTGPPGGAVQPGGEVGLRNRTLRQLIAMAWDTSEASLAGAPNFADTDHFDVMAKAPDSVARPVDLEAVRPMLRALLEERFGLKAHEEIRPTDVYVLQAPKGQVKMKPGNDAERGSCVVTPEKIPPNSGLSSAHTCTNMTMAEYAAELPGRAPNYVDHPVIDETGLQGTWNFTTLWTGLAIINGRSNAGQQGDRAEALAESGSLTLFEAIEKQLGPKMMLQKRSTPVLVIDSVNQKPTDN